MIGSANSTATVQGSRYVGSHNASATFWIDPTGQMQPPRQNPNQASEAMLKTNSPRRERLLMAKYEASDRASTKATRSRY